MHGSMITGPWSGPGSLGVLIDNLLGLAIMTSRPEGRWSVSAEISIDVVSPVPADGSSLRGTAQLLQADEQSGLASAEIFDESGRLVAVCRQRGRFIAQLPSQSIQDQVRNNQYDAGQEPGTSPAAETSGASREVREVREVGETALRSLLGARPLENGGSGLVLDVTEQLTNPLGNLHGGISFAACELAGLSALSADQSASGLQPGGAPLVTASIHVAYTRPLPIGTVATFVATVLHRGRTLGVAHVVGTNSAGKTCTVATVTAHEAG